VAETHLQGHDQPGSVRVARLQREAGGNRLACSRTSRVQGAVAASHQGLRPILLILATTVLGLAPMAIAGGALWQPMAVLMMMSGLAVASLLTLLFVPAGYFLLFRFEKDKPDPA
jgi:multidrug efflux pump subunit AcrB